jgi:signal transduction histidine kinase
VLSSIESNIPNANAKGINVSTEISDSTSIQGDKFTLETVIRNLINNAIKFTPKNGEVRICGKETESDVSILIKDNGVGMSNETLGKLFHIDENSSSLGTNNEKGTGLGLILCKEFVEMNNGVITVASKIGKGTIIKLSFNKKQKT